VPWPIKSKTGRYIEHGWTCERFIHGEAFRREDMSRIGSRLSLFQEATKRIQQRPGFLAARDLIHCDLGGDVDLRGMPLNIVALCREAWSRIEGQPRCVVHGDLNPSNLIRTEDERVSMLDWDECRVDAALFDSHQIGLNGSDKAIGMAVVAWEVACSWHLEPDHAIKVAMKLMRMASCPWRPVTAAECAFNKLLSLESPGMARNSCAAHSLLERGQYCKLHVRYY